MCKYPNNHTSVGLAASVVSSRSGSNSSTSRHHHNSANRNTCEVPGCGRVPRKSSDSARARFCTRHGGGRPCHYPGCQVAARGLLGFCYRHRHYANGNAATAAAYGNGIDGKAMPSPTPEATENDIRASRLESYVPVPSGIDSVELAALTYIASTLKASEAAAASSTAASDVNTPQAAIQDSTSVTSPGTPDCFSPITTPSSPASSAPSSPLLDSSSSNNNSQSLVPALSSISTSSTPGSPVTTPTASDPIDAAFANHSSASCDIDELFSIPTMPPTQRPVSVFGVPPPFAAKSSLPPTAAAVVGGATVACGPLGETPSLMDEGERQTVSPATVTGM